MQPIQEVEEDLGKSLRNSFDDSVILKKMGNCERHEFHSRKLLLFRQPSDKQTKQTRDLLTTQK